MSQGVFKRPFDMYADNFGHEPTSSCSPHRADFYLTAEQKRARRQASLDANRIVNINSVEPSNFQPSVSTADFMQQFSALYIPATKSVCVAPSNDMYNAASLIYGEKKKERKYTASEVQIIVQQALELREASLREDYENSLKTMLNQQFHSFQQYHNDYISKHLRKTDSSYIS